MPILSLIARIAETLLGIGLAAVTVLDVFDTVVVPGFTQGWLQAARRVQRLSLPLWRRRAKRLDGPLRIDRGLAPFIFIMTFVLWMALLVVGFGLIAHGLRDSYKPAIRTLPEAFFTAGSSIVTIGESGREAQGWARWGVLVSGFSGLAVMTMAITYILEVQNALQRRDASLAKLSTTAGRPPTGIVLLETYAELGSCSELGAFFREWRDWSAATLYSHASHPVLAYFRSISSEMDWPLAIGAVLDAAALYVAYVGGKETGAAMFLHRDGARLTAELARAFRVGDRDPDPLTEAQTDALRARLAAAGYEVREGRHAHDRFVSLRGDYHGRLSALAAHFGVDGVRLTT